MSQQLVLEADYDDFVIINKYLHALPRLNEYELKAINQKLIQRGQQEPIKVNKKMEILDGYTRHDLLGQRGVKIKYEFKHFETSEEEREYVTETNVMRRQLNVFQRVEAMYDLFLQETLARREKDHTSHYDILQLLNEVESLDTNQLVGKTKYSKRKILDITSELTSSYFISKGEKFIPHKNSKSVGGATRHTFTIMPKGVEMLSKREPRKVGSVSNMIGKIIGASRASVTRSTLLIEKADDITKETLREGRISISLAYSNLIGRVTRAKYSGTWRPDSNIECPHCNHVSKKSEYKKVD